ncbi:MAG: DUF4406 domain-containing protein [Lentisphaeria bacterium]|nr:DUF4406 domain-containing protein [Lentisphaeria bacterium]
MANSNGILKCYGKWQEKCEKCRKCPARGYCKKVKSSDEVGKVREAVSLQHPAALRAIAEAPENIVTPGGQSFGSWHAIKRIVDLLVSLHPVTLAAVKAAMSEPGMTRPVLMKKLGITPTAFQKRMQRSPEAARAAVGYPSEAGADGNVPLIRRGEYVYLSGPMTGLPEFNFPAFLKAEVWLAERFGCFVVSPRKNADLIGPGRDHSDYMRVALAELQCCTCMVLLDHWQQSKGCMMEFETANDRQIKIFQISDLLTMEE